MNHIEQNWYNFYLVSNPYNLKDIRNILHCRVKFQQGKLTGNWGCWLDHKINLKMDIHIQKMLHSNLFNIFLLSFYLLGYLKDLFGSKNIFSINYQQQIPQDTLIHIIQHFKWCIHNMKLDIFLYMNLWTKMILKGILMQVQIYYF